jgi:release factor glutamine methyltransferase
MRLRDALGLASSRLQEAGIDQPRREARLLAGHLLGLSPRVLPDPELEIDGGALSLLVDRRCAHEPLAYITGRRGFWTLDLAVSPDSLVPRPDSEALIEAALACFPDRRSVRQILDLGTGTGCLLLAALSEFTEAFGVGVDIEPGAALLAARNARSCGLADRAALLAGDWAAALAGRFDLVLCNPPYIPAGEIAGLMPEVGRYEPRRALDGGATGLDAYRALLGGLPALLASHGAAVIEVGAGQIGQVAALAEQAGLAHIKSVEDLAGLPRAVILRRPGG